MESAWKQRLPWAILLFFSVFYILISLVNHFCFRTYGLDLGMFNQAIYQFSHFENAQFTQGVNGEVIPYLGDHFSLLTVLLSPLYYLAGSSSLLIIQIAVLIWSGWILNRLLVRREWPLFERLLTMVLYLSMWGVVAAMSYDFHMNVIAAFLLIPCIYFFLEKKTKAIWLVFVLMLFAKENTSLWLFFVFTGMAWIYRSDSVLRNRALILSLVAIGYFVTVVGVVMPWLNAGKIAGPLQDHFLGSHDSLMDFILYQISHPIEFIDGLLKNGEGQIASTKITSIQFFCFAGGLLLFFKPVYIWMVLPIFLQKFLSNNPMMWDIKNQYSVEFAPIIILGLIAIAEVPRVRRCRLAMMSVVLISSVYWTTREVILRDVRSNLFSSEHYHSTVNRDSFRSIQQTLNVKGVLSVSSHLSPHVSNRSVVYIWPIVKEADYILIDRNRLEPNEHSVIDQMMHSLEWKVLKEEKSLLLLERNY